MQSTLARRSGAAVFLAIAVAAPAGAQVDYRNLDDDRPTIVEDAYPAERYAFEWLVPYRVERERSGTVVHAFLPELEYGIVRNAHVGVKAPLVARRRGGVTETGLSGLRLFALYNLNTEGPRLPALALRTDVALPLGRFGGEATQLGVKAMATRSWGPIRLHLNTALRFGPDRVMPLAEGLDRWWYGAALDRTLFRQSVLVIAELYARRAVTADPVEVSASLGLRWQWRPTTVIDVGVSRGLRQRIGPTYAVTVGISNAFALPGLMP